MADEQLISYTQEMVREYLSCSNRPLHVLVYHPHALGARYGKYLHPMYAKYYDVTVANLVVAHSEPPAIDGVHRMAIHMLRQALSVLNVMTRDQAEEFSISLENNTTIRPNLIYAILRFIERHDAKATPHFYHLMLVWLIIGNKRKLDRKMAKQIYACSCEYDFCDGTSSLTDMYSNSLKVVPKMQRILKLVHERRLKSSEFLTYVCNVMYWFSLVTCATMLQRTDNVQVWACSRKFLTDYKQTKY